MRSIKLIIVSLVVFFCNVGLSNNGLANNGTSSVRESQEPSSGSLKLTIIGSGSPQFNPDRAGPSALISYKNTHIIVDTGNGTQANLNKLSLKIKDLDGILYTHHHLDHNEEFIPIFIRSLLGDNHFSLAGPPPMKAMNESTLSQYKTDIEYRMRRSKRTLPDVLNNYSVMEITDESTFMIDEVKISTAKVKHTIDTIAYRFDAGGQSIVISGDLTYSESLSKLAKDTDVLLIESGGTIKLGGKPGGSGKKKQNLNSNKNTHSNRKGHQRAHVTLAETAKMAKDSNAKKIVLTHFTNGENDEPATIAELKKAYQGEIIFGTDLMTVTSNGHSSSTARISNSPIKTSSKPSKKSTTQSSYDPRAAERAAKKTNFTVRPTNPCTVTPAFENNTKITQDNFSRLIIANAIPGHKIGSFPNSGNPNQLSEQNKSYSVSLDPKVSNEITHLYDRAIDHGRPNYIFGVAINGVKFEPTANEYFYGQNGINYDWTIEALSKEVFLGDDCNNAHVQPNGEYHYHGSPTGFIDNLVSTKPANSMVLSGWAADGFPIYYAWGHSIPDDPQSPIKELKTSYQLRSGQRPGNGKTEPNGEYSGLYVRDYAYVKGTGDLDQCNGRQGVTPEFPQGTYYYMLTNQFPFVGRCLVGVPSDDFKVGGNRQAEQNGNQKTSHKQNGQSNRQQSQTNQNRPNPEKIMSRMDQNNDNQISVDEARGRLKENFSRRDQNADGFISLEELTPNR